MSTFYKMTKNPRTGKFEKAEWRDDYFGNHNYGIFFEDGNIFDERQVKLEIREFTVEELKKENEEFKRAREKRRRSEVPVYEKSELEKAKELLKEWHNYGIYHDQKYIVGEDIDDLLNAQKLVTKAECAEIAYKKDSCENHFAKCPECKPHDECDEYMKLIGHWDAQQKILNP